MRACAIYFVIFLLVVITALSSCKTGTEEAADVVVSLLGYEGCKLMPEADVGTLAQARLQECLEYDYDGRGTLVLKHVNTGFNCCPGVLTADVTVEGTRIRIVELEQEAGCHCLCLYDLDYRVENVPAGTCVVEFVCPYVEAHEEILAVALELPGTGSGKICMDRDHYPW